MRISDWSSDVCSSDLVAGRAENGDEDLRLADLAGLPVDDRRCLPGVIDEQLFASTMLLAHDHVDLGGPKAEVQIGRASCRERVCPYGLILLVAVSLKQKHNHVNSYTITILSTI